MTRTEIARLGAWARHKSMSKRARKASALKAVTARWARYRATVETCPTCQGKGTLTKTA